MTPFPLSPSADTAPIRSPDRTAVNAPHEEKFTVQPVEPVSRDLPKDSDAGSAAAPQVSSEKTEIYPDAAPTAVSDTEPAAATRTAPGANGLGQGLIQSLFATAGQNGTTGDSQTQNSGMAAQTTGQTGPDATAFVSSLEASATPPAPAVATATPPQAPNGAYPNGHQSPADTPAKTAANTTVAASVPHSGAKPAARGISGVQSDGTAIPERTVDAKPSEGLKPAVSVSEIASGKPGEGQTVLTVAATATSQNSTPNAALNKNPQLLAQAIASAGPEVASGATEAPVLKSATPPTVTADSMTVTQNFNAEMRAAIDAPTQSAAMTAKGAVTAQPAAEQVALQISRAAGQGMEKLTVHLKPAELGKITIDLEVGHDNRLIAVIAADKSETLDLLQRDARQLERALNEAGLKTDSGSLEFNLRGDGESAQNESEENEKLLDGAVMLPAAGDDVYGSNPHAQNPLILPEGRIDIQV